MPNTKKVVRRAWSKEDFRTLKTMARDKQGVNKIARALKRSPGATSVMAVPVGNSILLATDIESGDAPALCERFVA